MQSQFDAVSKRSSVRTSCSLRFLPLRVGCLGRISYVCELRAVATMYTPYATKCNVLTRQALVFLRTRVHIRWPSWRPHRSHSQCEVPPSPALTASTLLRTQTAHICGPDGSRNIHGAYSFAISSIMACRGHIVVQTLPDPQKTSVHIPDASRHCKTHCGERVAHFAPPRLHFPPMKRDLKNPHSRVISLL